MTDPHEKNGLRSHERTASGFSSFSYFSTDRAKEEMKPITEVTMRKTPIAVGRSTHGRFRGGASMASSRSSSASAGAVFTLLRMPARGACGKPGGPGLSGRTADL
ncbi:hypothetical protein GCM10009700_03530 [Brevibacterium sanguinis]